MDVAQRPSVSDLAVKLARYAVFTHSAMDLTAALEKREIFRPKNLAADCTFAETGADFGRESCGTLIGTRKDRDGGDEVLNVCCEEASDSSTSSDGCREGV